MRKVATLRAFLIARLVSLKGFLQPRSTARIWKAVTLWADWEARIVVCDAAKTAVGNLEFSTIKIEPLNRRRLVARR